MPDGRGTFVRLSVAENLKLGAYMRPDPAGIRADLERVEGYFPVLAERRRQQAGTLSGGEQQMLAIGRALMLRPRLLLLDEPSFGLAPLVIREIFEILGRINREDRVSMLLVEQNAELALDLARARLSARDRQDRARRTGGRARRRCGDPACLPWLLTPRALAGRRRARPGRPSTRLARGAEGAGRPGKGPGQRRKPSISWRCTKAGIVEGSGRFAGRGQPPVSRGTDAMPALDLAK